MTSIDPTAAQLEDFAARAATVTGPIRMVNLLRFHDVADYGDAADPGETGPSTGAEALWSLRRGGDARGRCGWWPPVRGGDVAHDGYRAEDETWDLVAIIEYPSAAAFLEMIAKESYRTCVHHRTAGLADTRIIMTTSLMG